MRIVLLNQYYAPDESATAQLLSDLGEGLAAAGHEVRAICCSRAYADPSQRYPRREEVRGVSVRRTWASGFGRGTRLGRVSDYLTFLAGAGAALLFSRRADVVISLSTPPLVAAVGLVLARLRGAGSLYWVMDVYPDLAFALGVIRPRSVAGRLFSRVSRFALHGSDVVVSLGESMTERLRASGVGGVRTVHNWSDGDSIRALPVARSALRREWGWGDRFVLLYSGNMGLAHEFETVLDGAEALRGEPRFLLAFVGGGPRRAEVEAEVRRRGLPNVEFKPYVARERLGDCLGAGDAHLVTLRDGLEGMLVPSKIYGILAAGRPTLYVGPGRGEIADIIEAGRCGSRVASGDGPGLADAIRRYLDDDRLGEEQGSRARALFDERFTRERALGAFQRLIAAGTRNSSRADRA